MKKFLQDANGSLKEISDNMHLKKMDAVIKKSTYDLGGARVILENCLGKYCDVALAIEGVLF